MTKKWMLLMVFVLLVSCVACKKENSEPVTVNVPVTETEETTAEITEAIVPPTEPVVDLHLGQDINPLTGLYIDEAAAKRRPIGIMINNLKAALPQSGIAQADVMYETLVEGAICRIFAVFQDFDAQKIGPVRSARHYFLDFAFDFDAIYVHYGQSPQAQTAISNLDSPAFNGLSYLDMIMCFQDPKRVRPHSTYTSYEGLMAAWDNVGYRRDISEGLVSKFDFSEEDYTPDSAIIANKLSLSFSYYQQPYFQYNKEEGLYARFQFDEPHIDVEINEQLKYKNIIVQIADMWVIPGDEYGRMDMDLITSGKGYFLTNGRAVPITWKKTSHTDPTQYYLEDGSPLLLNKGKTWIAVFPSNRAELITIE